MHPLEKTLTALRHNPSFYQADWFWDRVRPCYEGLLAILGRGGLKREINGTDPILILPRYRSLSEDYEPEIWKQLMKTVYPGDFVADVGAFIGVYTIALAKRVGTDGRVFAFEPDPDNRSALKAHLELNNVSERVSLFEAAISMRGKKAQFKSGQSCFSQLSLNEKDKTTSVVPSIRLDEVFEEQRLDLLKIDVEGFEEEVLKSGARLISDRHRGPRSIFIEVHPNLWPLVGTTSESLLGFLDVSGYDVYDSREHVVKQIDSLWGHFIARRRPDG